MKRFSSIFLVPAVLLFMAANCEKPGPGPEPDEGLEVVEYQASDADFPNPERGFYSAAEVYSADGRGVAQASLKANRLQGRTLFLLEFHLTDFKDQDISEEYLQTIRKKFQSMRDGGCKCILRFCYSNGFDEKDKPWDATPDQVNRHIDQLQAIIKEYYDIIMVVQAGFIGSWGEWYYTENFTTLSERRALVDRLLEVVPADRQIELRTPAYKMKLYDYSLSDTLTLAEAHQPTKKARLAGHNDCYLSSINDVGTFSSNKERQYWGAESLYTIMGGESCEVSAYCHCEPQSEKIHGALADLAMYHFTYLNNGYHPNVLRRWRDEGCMEEIKKRLGYRFVLEEGKFTKEAQAGNPFEIKLTLRNDGFAPAMNPRDVELILADASGKAVKTWPIDSDPRYWMPGQQTTIEQIITLPEGISGAMTLYLNLPDPCTNLRGNPFYSIRLANEGIWKEDTGYNQIYTFNI